MKKGFCCIVFVLLLVMITVQLTDILTPKSQNRYYILEEYLQDHPEENLHDVQIFGSCHSYTSFNPIYMEQAIGVSGFVYGNAGEIIPTTYVRMEEQFRKHTPKVALVEIWGINPYETYSSHQRVFGFYLANNLERTAFSPAKLQVIRDFGHMDYEDIDLLSMNLPLINYKDRLLDGSLTDVDFSYSFENTKPYSTTYMYNEMTSRLANNGFKANPPEDISDYPEKQSTISEDAYLEIEPDIVEYIQKIIDLCKEKNVTLIFYRSPYTSRKNELKKLNHLRKICRENDVAFVDLEAEIQFDYTTDFLDYQHLSEIGANKATEHLLPYITQVLGIDIPAADRTFCPNLLSNCDFQDPENSKNALVFTTSGETIDGWYTNFSDDTVRLTSDGVVNTISSAEAGWHFYQSIEIGPAFAGTSVTAYFSTADCGGETLRATISCRDANDKEISAASSPLLCGEQTIAYVIPPDTKYIRVGIFSREGSLPGDSFTLKEIELYPAALTLEHLSQK